ncbi:MAG: PSD1 domain-containing protein [Planctomycetales bacterium]|nr:PSD1 domain-containing protein [Planctomycetales bacterium]
MAFLSDQFCSSRVTDLSRRALVWLVVSAAITLLPTSGLAEDGIAFFENKVRPILVAQCYECHSEEAGKQKGGLLLDRREGWQTGGDSGPALIPGDVDQSLFAHSIRYLDEDLQMPPKNRLATEEIEILERWIAMGAPDPRDEALTGNVRKEPIDFAKARQNWAFRPHTRPTIPKVEDAADANWGRDEIDDFILAELKSRNLSPVPDATPGPLLRRLFYDLTGLPPTPEEVAAFEKDPSPKALAAVVDDLLNRPAFGEKWGRHWLDVARYADSNGGDRNYTFFQAWRYRNYVIDSFNRDRSFYDFVQQQLAGDLMLAESDEQRHDQLVASTFLAMGPKMLTERDKEKLRLDTADEQVDTVGRAFLGLTMGCARCHDHKFDPISQRDYYSMQAFVAGVEYADREMLSPDSEMRRLEAKQVEDRLAEIDRDMSRYVPLARVGQPSRAPIDARDNVENFDPLVAKFVRFTIHDANLHPTLGLIEPCVDEFEIFSNESPPRNVALAAAGAKVTASGSRTSASHRLEHVNDGQYGNGRSWMADEAGRGWLLFELPEAVEIDSIVWSRDRTGGYSDRLATAYSIEAGPALDSMSTLVSVLPPRPSVNARENVDRFQPILAQKLRLTIHATNSLEPCLDELEVFDLSGRNVALADEGAIASSSGDTTVADRHELRFVNDGRYGNSRSWMSGQAGKGSVTLEFPNAVTIERVVWGRDREGKFADRLTTDYTIEVADPAGVWRTVADASDRAPFNADQKSPSRFTTVGLLPDEVLAAERLLQEREDLKAKLSELTRSLLVFAGRFRPPDEIHLLRRGDPEQPQEQVSPAVPALFGDLDLASGAPEAQRRVALAQWIANADNPLTARVMVNRIWQGHFGIGLVSTSNDFGNNGGSPSHPELLDWLAEELVRSGWSIKHMHRLIVLSSVYRQSTHHNAEAAQRDADVRLLWRYPTRRLEGESIRDSILAVSGQLNTSMYGRGFDLFDKRGGLTGFEPLESFQDEGLRRMIYAHKVRRERDAVFGAFDCPDAGQSTPRRRESTTPIQALNLLNSRFVLDQSQAFAERVRRMAAGDLEKQICAAYQLALSRDASAEEIAAAMPVVRAHGLPTLCRALLNSNEFLFIP